MIGCHPASPPCGAPRTIVVDAEAEGCDRVAVEARDFQVEDGGGRDGAGMDMGDQDWAREARDPFAGTKIGEGCPPLAVERPDGMVGRAHQWRGRALEGDRGQAISDGPEASGDSLPATLTASNYPEFGIAPQWGARPRRQRSSPTRSVASHRVTPAPNWGDIYADTGGTYTLHAM